MISNLNVIMPWLSFTDKDIMLILSMYMKQVFICNSSAVNPESDFNHTILIKLNSLGGVPVVYLIKAYEITIQRYCKSHTNI